MTVAARVHQPAASTGLPALGTMVATSYTLPDTASLTFNTNGTLTYFKEQTSGVSTWYGATSAGIGSSYEIRFTLTSGTAWDAGLVSGTWYSLSSARAVALTASTVDLSSVIAVDIRLAAGGAIVTSGTLNLGVYNEP